MPDRDDVVDAVAAQLGQVGVKATIQALDLAAFNDRWVAHTMDGLFSVRWNNFSDPGTLNLLASCSGFLSFSCSQAADAAFSQGEGTLDDAARVKAYQQAMRALNDEPFAIYLTTRSALFGVSDRVSGWKPSASGYLYATKTRSSGNPRLIALAAYGRDLPGRAGYGGGVSTRMPTVVSRSAGSSCTPGRSPPTC